MARPTDPNGGTHPYRADAEQASTRDGETEDMLPAREAQSPPTVHHVHRQPFGLGPSPLLAILAGVSVVLAIVLFAVGSVTGGIVFLVLAGAAVSLFLVAIRREPEAQSARLAMTGADRIAGLSRLTAVGFRAWFRTSAELIGLWWRRAQLRRELRRRLTPLGEAVHHDDQDRVAILKAEASELERALRETDRDAFTAVDRARRQVDHERGAVQPTQSMPVQPADAAARRAATAPDR